MMLLQHMHRIAALVIEQLALWAVLACNRNLGWQEVRDVHRHVGTVLRARMAQQVVRARRHALAVAAHVQVVARVFFFFIFMITHTYEFKESVIPPYIFYSTVLRQS